MNDDVRNVLKQLVYTDEFIDLNKFEILGYESYEYFDLTDICGTLLIGGIQTKGFYKMINIMKLTFDSVMKGEKL